MKCKVTYENDGQLVTAETIGLDDLTKFLVWIECHGYRLVEIKGEPVHGRNSKK